MQTRKLKPNKYPLKNYKLSECGSHLIKSYGYLRSVIPTFSLVKVIEWSEGYFDPAFAHGVKWIPRKPIRAIFKCRQNNEETVLKCRSAE